MATSDEPDAAPDAIRSRAREAVGRAWEAAVRAGALPALPDDAARPAIGIERPANAAFGDLATNLAMQLARPLRRPPLEIAEAIAAALRDGPDGDLVASAEVARPGFVNLRVADAAYEATVDRILNAPADWGRFRPASPRSVDVEFVSANPTGPLTHRQRARRLRRRPPESRPRGRRAAASRASTTSTTSAPRCASSARPSLAMRNGEPVPEDGYHGDYVEDLAASVPDDVWSGGRLPPGADGAESSARGRRERVRAGIEASLEHLGVHFDVWKSEGSLHRDGWVDRAVERLRAGGHVYEQDGALWFRSTDLRRRQGPGHLSAPPASRPTSRLTSATSPRSSAAASTT